MKRTSFARRLLTLAATALLAALLVPASAQAATIVESGECGAQGDNVTWTLDSDGLLTIQGTGDMDNWDGWHPWPFDAALIKSVVIKPGVTSIGDYSFDICDSLTSASIPSSVTYIGNSAFSCCRSLASVSIPSSVTRIGMAAFGDCTSLTSVSIPEGVTSVEAGTFCGCSSLTSVFIPEGVTSIGNQAFRYCSSLTTISIPSTVTSINWWAFGDCSSLTSVRIPGNVNVIGEYAFENCTSLTSASIPKSVTAIDKGAFWGCKSLSSVSISKGVASIGKYAFSGCDSLMYVYVPSSVTSIGSLAFCVDSSSDVRGVVVEAGSANVYAQLVNGGAARDVRVVADLSICKVTLSYTSTTYSGKAKTPAVTVKLGSAVVPAEGFTVAYKNNIQVGTATATVTATGNGMLVGKTSATFSIKPKPEGFIVSKITAAVNYNGTITKAAYPIKSITGNKGPLEYSKVSGSEYLKVTKTGETAGKYTGKVTVAPKTPVGTYQMVMRIKDTATGFSKDVTVSVKVARFAPTISIAKRICAVKYSKTKDRVVEPITQVVCVSKPMEFQRILEHDPEEAHWETDDAFSVDRATGAVTVKAGTRPGTYKVQIKVLSNDNANYKQNWKIIACAIRVK